MLCPLRVDYVDNLFKNHSNGNGEAFFSRVAEDVNWTVMGTHPMAGVHKNKADFLKHPSGRLSRVLKGRVDLKVNHNLVSGETAVVEMTSTCDWYVPHFDESANKVKTCCTTSVNPRITSTECSYDPRQPLARIPRKVVKGGSHICAPNYCLRYRPSVRQPQMIDTVMTHLGFRCIIRTV